MEAEVKARTLAEKDVKRCVAENKNEILAEERRFSENDGGRNSRLIEEQDQHEGEAQHARGALEGLEAKIKRISRPSKRLRERCLRPEQPLSHARKMLQICSRALWDSNYLP